MRAATVDRESRQTRCNPTDYLSVSTFHSQSAPAPAPRLAPLRARGPVPLRSACSRTEQDEILANLKAAAQVGVGVTHVPILK
jgi:hypothetical protein